MRSRRPLDDRELQRLLGLPQAPESLRTQLHATFAQQLQARAGRRRRLAGGGLAGVLAVSLTLMVLGPEHSPPPLVDTARMHSQREASLSGRFVTDYGLWLQTHYINAPPATMGVELAKYCELQGRIFLHLRLTSAGSGPIDLFLYAGDEAGDLAAGPSRGPAMGWEALHPRPGLYALVLYKDKAARAQVDELIRTLFPERALSAGRSARAKTPSPESGDQRHV
jgi:hypothetical protein